MLRLIKEALLKQGCASKTDDVVFDSYTMNGKCAYRGATRIKGKSKRTGRACIYNAYRVHLQRNLLK